MIHTPQFKTPFTKTTWRIAWRLARRNRFATEGLAIDCGSTTLYKAARAWTARKMAETKPKAELENRLLMRYCAREVGLEVEPVRPLP